MALQTGERGGNLAHSSIAAGGKLAYSGVVVDLKVSLPVGSS